VAKVELEAVLQKGRPASWVLGVNRPRCLRFFLAVIWRHIPTKDLTRLAEKWG
jgi:hypothetical protein